MKGDLVLFVSNSSLLSFHFTVNYISIAYYYFSDLLFTSMASVKNMTDEQVDKVFEDCMNLENTFYQNGWSDGMKKVGDEAFNSGKQYGYFYTINKNNM